VGSLCLYGGREKGERRRQDLLNSSIGEADSSDWTWRPPRPLLPKAMKLIGYKSDEESDEEVTDKALPSEN
jgi:hypothetical protein